LTKVLTYHVVPGKYDFNALQNEITRMNGRAELKTASGGTLHFAMNGPHTVLMPK
jgi:uncharacterized surface protein with fasciclin (FAS1) repeats